jgi:TPR repeat protein
VPKARQKMLMRFEYLGHTDMLLEPKPEAVTLTPNIEVPSQEMLSEWKRLAELGSPLSMRRLGSYFEHRAREAGGPSYTLALEWFQKAVDRGAITPTLDLARMFEVRHDYVRLETLLRGAVSRGYTPAMCRLSRLIGEGKIRSGSQNEAQQLLLDAAVKGHLYAQFMLLYNDATRCKNRLDRMVWIVLKSIPLGIEIRIEKLKNHSSERLLK